MVGLCEPIVVAAVRVAYRWMRRYCVGPLRRFFAEELKYIGAMSQDSQELGGSQ